MRASLKDPEEDLADPLVVAPRVDRVVLHGLERYQSGAHDDGAVIAVEAVLTEHLAGLPHHELQLLFAVCLRLLRCRSEASGGGPRGLVGDPNLHRVEEAVDLRELNVHFLDDGVPALLAAGLGFVQCVHELSR